ncbi:hypothetical protein H8D79_00255 [PVC group bacterium]|nr:hypothetical protein [PVC group bacterium]
MSRREQAYALHCVWSLDVKSVEDRGHDVAALCRGFRHGAVAVFLFRLGARRQLDYELGGDPEQDADLLGNVNRLANTEKDSVPVHRTLTHYVTDHLQIRFDTS